MVAESRRRGDHDLDRHCCGGRGTAGSLGAGGVGATGCGESDPGGCCPGRVVPGALIFRSVACTTRFPFARFTCACRLSI